MSVFSSTASFRGRYSLLLLKAAWKLKKLPLNSLKKSLKRSLILWPVFPFPKLWKLLLDWTCLPTLPETAQKS
jgi:hypothetical protein